jgi:HK97 gp10 family phage protein
MSKPPVEFKIEGLDGVMDAMNGLADKVQQKLVREAGAKAMEPVVAEARDRCPSETGNLRESIGLKHVKMRGRYKKGLIVLSIGPRKGFDWAYAGGNRKHVPFKYGIPVEYGHVNKNGTFTPPTYFMRTAYYNQREQVVDRFKAYLWTAVGEEWKKQNKRQALADRKSARSA